MENIKHKILVLSGKGGVGKSSIAVNLAVWLSTQGKKVGLLDIDIHGPSIPKLLNLEDRGVLPEGDKIKPILYGDTMKIMSIGFLLAKQSDALIWRGPMKHNVIKQFVTDVSWGNLDYLVVDCPPGTGDEPLSMVQLLGNADGAVIVTTPQQLSVVDVKKCITFCRQLNLPILGVIENMSGFVCPHCKNQTDIFKGGGGTQMAEEFNVDGIIGERLQFCDNWLVEHYMTKFDLKEHGDIPFIQLDREYILSGKGQLKTRVQAFLEILES